MPILLLYQEHHANSFGSVGVSIRNVKLIQLRNNLIEVIEMIMILKQDNENTFAASLANEERAKFRV